MVRSRHAHGVIRAIDTAAARAMPGVLAVYTGGGSRRPVRPAASRARPFKNRDGTPMLKPVRHALATDKVRFVGEPVAARGRRDAGAGEGRGRGGRGRYRAAARRHRAATRPHAGAPQLYDDVPGNVGARFPFRRQREGRRRLRAAPRMSPGSTLRNNRIVVNAMEPRAAIAAYDPASGRFTLHVGCQGVFGLRNYIAGVLGVGRDKVRVLTDNVGGSFGMKARDLCRILLHPARGARARPPGQMDRRPLRAASSPTPRPRPRDDVAELALDADGNFLAVRLTGYGNLGATSRRAAACRRATPCKNTVGVYRTPLIEVSTKCVFTNTTPVGGLSRRRPARGQLLHGAAGRHAPPREMGIDRVELRRRNHIQPSEMPYKAPNGSRPMTAAISPTLLEQGAGARRLGGLRGSASARAKKRGKLRGRRHRQLSRTHRAAGQRDGRHPLRAQRRRHDHHRHARLRPGPRVAVRAGAGEQLGIPFERIRLLQGDSDELIAGGGTGGSRSMMRAAPRSSRRPRR